MGHNLETMGCSSGQPIFPMRLFAGESHAERCARFFKQPRHSKREGMCDLGALAQSVPNQPTEMIGFVIEAAVREGFVQFHFAAFNVMNGCPRGVPPVRMQSDIAAGSAE